MACYGILPLVNTAYSKETTKCYISKSSSAVGKSSYSPLDHSKKKGETVETKENKCCNELTNGPFIKALTVVNF